MVYLTTDPGQLCEIDDRRTGERFLAETSFQTVWCRMLLPCRYTPYRQGNSKVTLIRKTFMARCLAQGPLYIYFTSYEHFQKLKLLSVKCLEHYILCVCMCVTLFIQHVNRMRHIITSSMASSALSYLSILSQKLHDFRKKSYGTQNTYLFWLSLNFF